MARAQNLFCLVNSICNLLALSVGRDACRKLTPGKIDLSLSARECELLALVAAGKTNGEIATLLAISPRTVQKHLEHIFQKLGVETRTAAAIRTPEAGDDLAAASNGSREALHSA
jgi:DNA-binding CsgD family transcriptional regulator